MDSTSVELNGSTIGALSQDDDLVRVTLAPAFLIKTMTGSDERTRWTQNLVLEFTDAEVVSGADIALPAQCQGGDVGENVYTYRDMIPVPLESRGRAHCLLRIQGSDQVLRVQAAGVKLIAEGRPEYVEHIR